MAIRKIVHIDEDKCDGCGDCVPSCAEGAIQIIDGKARLVKDNLCDGLGACLGDCHAGAITIEEREADGYSETAVQEYLSKMKTKPIPVIPNTTGGCPGSAVQQFGKQIPTQLKEPQSTESSQLEHWPVQLMLVPPHAPFLQGKDIIICADCVPFALPDFHSRYLSGRAVLVGCPKLDDLQHYYEKFQAIFSTAQPKSILVLQMEVPCCGGIVQAALQARNLAAPEIPLEVHTIGIKGDIHVEQQVERFAG
jgi:NAD-dependent dihydropyrimidine dehydrogenase PreA subunit